MRVTSDTRDLEVAPASTASVVVDVVNTGEVIDGVTARVIGIPEQLVTAHPALLPLFPDASGTLTLAVSVPPTYPAGRHPLTVEVVSHGAGEPSQFLDVDLQVEARPALRLAAQTRVVRARRSARFVLELANEGNVALDVTLLAADADRATSARLSPDAVRLDAGATVAVLLTLRGPRMFTGGEIDRSVTVKAAARRVDLPEDTVIEDAVAEQPETTVRLRQRPTISRGLLTACILAGIVALWAGVFLLGLTKVFSNDPMTKDAPASFFVAAKNLQLAANQTPGTAPAGALPKSGQLPPGLGGVISGTVTSANDKQPVGRILVQAMRLGPKGLARVSSAATQSDGSYTLAGLFPLSYELKFTAPGFHTIWYPSAGSAAGARPVSVSAQGTTSGVNVVIKGDPASISGSVDPGATLKRVTTTVIARPLSGARAGKPVATATTNAAESYVLHGLPAPGTYELTFTTPGYQASTLVDTVNGGEKRLEPAVSLPAGLGQISGTVTDGTTALGGVTVSTTVAGKTVTVTTPTTGQVGAYVIGNLPTPATYVISFSAKGFGAKTTIVDLAAGQAHSQLDPSLAAGTGSITGRVVDTTRAGVGDVTVTVGGSTSSSASGVRSTVTLSAGDVGSFAINGLHAPGSYTLTFTRSGFAPTTVPVRLAGSGPPPRVTVTLSTQVGSITGVVTDADGAPFVGATVTATNGSRDWTVTSSEPGAGLTTGGYLIASLQPGSYSVTVTAAGQSQQTALVTVAAGKPTRQNLRLGR